MMYISVMPYFHPVAYDGYIRHVIYAPNYVKKRHLTPDQSMRAIAHYAKRITTTSTLGHMASGIHECQPKVKLQRAERSCETRKCLLRRSSFSPFWPRDLIYCGFHPLDC